MTEWQPTLPRPTLAARGRRAARRALPAAVWAAAAAGALALSQLVPSTHEFRGVADSVMSTVAAPASGQVQSLLVTLHQEVEAGDVIARLDDRAVRLELTAATYELERLRADMARRTADQQLDARLAAAEQGLETGVERRRLVTAVEACQLDALATRTELEEARIRMQGAAIETDRLTKLLAQGMVGEPQLVRMRTSRDALRKRIAELERLHTQQRSRTEKAQLRLDEFAPDDVAAAPIETMLAPMRWRLKAHEATLERLALDARNLILEAPIAGLIQNLTTQPGEWVRQGQPLATIASPTPHRILAYVENATRAELTARGFLSVTRNDRTRLGATTVKSISAVVVPVPERLRRNPRLKEWAYEVVLAPTGREVPGELVDLAPTR